MCMGERGRRREQAISKQRCKYQVCHLVIHATKISRVRDRALRVVMAGLFYASSQVRTLDFILSERKMI